MLRLLQCDEEAVGFGDEVKTAWRYSLSPRFDRETLLAMTSVSPLGPKPSPEM